MKLKKILAGTVLMLAAGGYSQQLNPMTQAMLSSYAEILKQDPKDYLTLYQRALQYAQLGMNDDALADIGKALKYTPEKEKDMLAQEYALLADIAIAKKDFSKALESIDRALFYTPGDYAFLYKKGEICLWMEDAENAEKSFKSMLNIKSRSPEAFFGLAQAAVMKGDTNKAEELMKELENTNINNWLTYSRLGDLYDQLGDTQRAATNYIVSYSLASDPSRPLTSLSQLAEKDFDGVRRALEFAASKSDSKTALTYLLAYLAYNTGHYDAAAAALDNLLATKEGEQQAVYNLKALNDLALGKNTEAINNVNKAMNEGESLHQYLLKAEALMQNNQPSSALIEAKRALNMNPNSVDAMAAAARAAIAANDASAAIDYLNEWVMTDPGSIEALFLRGYVNTEMLKNGKQGASDYIRASNMEADGFPAIAYKALAKAKAGKKLDADSIMEKALAVNSDKNACYYAAVYYAQSGSLAKAEEMMKKALSLGYDNQYNLKTNKFANFNISPIRHLL